MKRFAVQIRLLTLPMLILIGCHANSADGPDSPNSATSKVNAQCNPGQTECSGTCRDLDSDPDNCGQCGHECPSGQACSGGRCVSECPGDGEVCDRRCVDTSWNSDHCGACGRSCGSDKVCTRGSCQQPAGTQTRGGKCTSGGPPIFTGQSQTAKTCAGKVARKTFRWAICSCDGVAVGNAVETDAFDSSRSPYQSGSVGGAVGTNGPVFGENVVDIDGSLWTSSERGVEIENVFELSQELHSAGPIRLGVNAQIGDDVYAGDDLRPRLGLEIDGTLYIDPSAEVEGQGPEPLHGVEWDRKVEQPVDVPTVCKRCAEDERIPIDRIVADHRSDNDNAAVGLASDALSGIGNAEEIDLPCGEYYFDEITAENAVTIRARGHTAIYVDGDIRAGNTLELKPVGNATLDVFVRGDVYTENAADLGSTRRPSATRMYVGGSNGLVVRNAVEMGANVYAIPGGVHTDNALDLYGGLYVQTLDVGNAVDIHYDRNVLEAGKKCPTPDRPGDPDLPGVDVGDGADAGQGSDGGGTPGSGSDGGGTPGSGSDGGYTADGGDDPGSDDPGTGDDDAGTGTDDPSSGYDAGYENDAGQYSVDGGGAGSGGDDGSGGGDDSQCLDKGASCSADGDCCAPMVCDEGRCALVECQQIGDSCQDDGECCTGICASNVCTGT